MPHPGDNPNLAAALDRLRASLEDMPWSERRELAASLAEPLASQATPDTALEILRLLADDPKPEVRKEVADLLVLVPREVFEPLAARLADDTSAFVQKAIARALDRRRRGMQDAQRRRQGFEHVETRYAFIERFHGALAAERARRIADEQFDCLVGATVHDIRGILNPLKARLTSLIEQRKAGAMNGQVFGEGLSLMNDRLAYLERFVDDMRDYSRATPAERRRERIADVVHEAGTVVLDNLKSRGIDAEAIKLTVEAPENVTAEVARHQIVSAVAHVLKNSFESFEDNPGRPQITVRARLVPGDRVEIVVADNGSGIAADDLADIRQFRPGTSTKKNRGGTGFGLPTAHRYALAHGGGLAIESEEGCGTEVTITLPVEQEEIEE